MLSLPLTRTTLSPQSQTWNRKQPNKLNQPIAHETSLPTWCSWSRPVFKRPRDQFTGLLWCPKPAFTLHKMYWTRRSNGPESQKNACLNICFRQTLFRPKSSSQSRADKMYFWIRCPDKRGWVIHNSQWMHGKPTCVIIFYLQYMDEKIIKNIFFLLQMFVIA